MFWISCNATLSSLLLWACLNVPVHASTPALLAEAELAFSNLQLDEAARLTRTFETNQGTSARSYYLRTRIDVLRGRLQTATQVADICIEQFPTAALCYEAKGEAELISLIIDPGIFNKFGKARRARRALEQALQHDPQNMRARLLLVRFYTLAPWIMGGSKSKARAQVAACRKTDPAWGHEAQALYDLGTGDTAAAVAGFAEAHRLRPTERDPAAFLAKAYLADNRPEAAIDTLERLVQRYPQFQETWLELGKIAAEKGLRSTRGTAALEYYLDNAKNESPQRRVEAATALAHLYRASGRTGAALAVLQRAVSESTDSRVARHMLKEMCSAEDSTC